ncbi:DUF6092 family protein [Streptomyces sp. NRRL F-5123]|uniref:DUF6092 family protein n=1 Tax=Streptomyces sp. NRRL F-5123 TaxID=1463856 RepID=UPI0004E22846|nr:DUF6092 family protein [Streptomyces sp. NRRL F-5123]
MTHGSSDSGRMREELLLLAAFLLSSGRGLADEPAVYGQARCLDAARRTLALVEGLGGQDPAVTGLRTELEAFMTGPIGGCGDINTLLDSACDRLAEVLCDRGRDVDLLPRP